uniref:NB-ARC domain-containing protein n=1 Tax=Manihot esculenta TaxID=3983 RepID=A0A2C9V4N4_MANES
MVEAIVTFAIERIADAVVREASSLYGVRQGVEQLQTELKRIRCFLKDADSKQDQDERVRNCIAEIRDIAYEAEDIIDTFILKAETGSRKRVWRLIKRVTSMVIKVPYLHEIGNQIKSIQDKIGSVSTSMLTYNIKLVAEGEGSRSTSEMQRRLRRSFPHDEEDEDVIRLEASLRDVQSQLMVEEEQRRVVSIVGMGGLGKTTLAKALYNDNHVKQHFDCHSWSFISQQFSARDVLVGILTEVTSKQDKFDLKRRMEEEQVFQLMLKQMKVAPMFYAILERMSEEKLVETLFQVLKKKRYFVVLDDIWQNEVWDSLKHAFPAKGKKGSKVLLTTRNKEVAAYADPWSSPVEPPLLTNDEAWELLSRKAFPKDILIKDGCQREHESLGREMVKKCGGLPLAIVVLGGLLATKKTLKEWEVVRSNINAQFVLWERHHQYGGVYGILALSYHDLPFYLKPFFLYFSQFPEDWEIHKRMLIRMWAAEGFLSRALLGGNEAMEDMGERYLEELANRCMVQVSQRDYTGMGIKTCRIHDLMRDMCVLMARKENFLGISEHYHENIVARRIAVHPKISPDSDQLHSITLMPSNSRHRSFFYFLKEQRYEMKFDHRSLNFDECRLLRVLNLWGLKVEYIPNEIGDLIHLRYLGLRNTKVSMEAALPTSIGNLRSLCTLDVRNNQSLRLPDVVWKLKNLRHLFVDLLKILEYCRMDTLRNLETLKWAHPASLIRKNAMHKLTNLRNIAIGFNKREEIDLVMKSPIFSKGSLHSLNILARESSFPSLEPLSHCQSLKKLELRGEIPEHPSSLHHNLEFLPVSLNKLILSNSGLNQDPMSFLQKLPNLSFLHLEDKSYKGTKMGCSAHGFPQLETLKLEGLGVQEWKIEEGAMPCLKILHLEKLQELEKIPEGIEFITKLRELKVINMKKKFARKIQVIHGVEGEDFDKVKHISSISVSTTI